MVENLKIGDSVRYFDSQSSTFYSATVISLTAKMAVVDLAWEKGKRVSKDRLYPNARKIGE